MAAYQRTPLSTLSAPTLAPSFLRMTKPRMTQSMIAAPKNSHSSTNEPTCTSGEGTTVAMSTTTMIGMRNSPTLVRAST